MFTRGRMEEAVEIQPKVHSSQCSFGGGYSSTLKPENTACSSTESLQAVFWCFSPETSTIAHQLGKMKIKHARYT